MVNATLTHKELISLGLTFPLLPMKKQIQICLVQPDIVWEDVPANLGMLDEMTGTLQENTDLVVLPETFSTGFTMRADRYAEEGFGVALNWMLKLARERQVYVTGSLIIREQGNIYNRLYWISSGGIEGYYNKRHLFRMGREDQHFRAGTTREVFTLGSARFLPQICYDLRFPVFARNRNDYDVLFYVANWPASRHAVWESLLRARAIENQTYVIGVSRVGTDGEGMDHLGGSCVINAFGKVTGLLDHQPGILNCTLDIEKVREFREKFPVWKDSDNFSLE